ncbi:MAG: hypothetical protein ACXW3D_07700 [Caulobacteraceae bacterium]
MIDNTAPAPASRGDTDKVLGLLNYAMMFFAHWLGFIPAIIAVVLAYARRDAADPVARSHYDFQIKTFWIGLVLVVIAIGFTIGAAITGTGALVSGGTGWVPGAVGLGAGAGMLGLGAICAYGASWLWTLIASAYGFIKQVTGSGIGTRA